MEWLKVAIPILCTDSFGKRDDGAVFEDVIKSAGLTKHCAVALAGDMSLGVKILADLFSISESVDINLLMESLRESPVVEASLTPGEIFKQAQANISKTISGIVSENPNTNLSIILAGEIDDRPKLCVWDGVDQWRGRVIPSTDKGTARFLRRQANLSKKSGPRLKRFLRIEKDL